MIHIQDKVSSPKCFLNAKYNKTAIPQASNEKMNCLIDSPKNTDSL